MRVRAPNDRRFHRARTRPPRRRRLWQLLPVRLVRTMLLLGFIGFLSVRLAELVLAAPTFEVRQILVRGNQRLAAGEVLELVAGRRGESIVLTDLAAWREQLLASPWVEDAALRRILPATVEIVISERRPMGLARFGRQLYLVDRRGTIIDEYGPHQAGIDLPIIDGLGVPSAGGQSVVVDQTRAEAVAALIDDLVHGGGDLIGRVSQVDASDPRNLIVLLNGDPARIQLGEGPFFQRLQAYEEMVPALRARVPEIDYVDLRFEERVYVRPGRAVRQPAPTRRPTPGSGTRF